MNPLGSAFPAAKVILMRGQGTLALGLDLRNAYDLSDLAEDTAKIAFIEGNIKMADKD